jgi:hypothetical protein
MMAYDFWNSSNAVFTHHRTYEFHSFSAIRQILRILFISMIHYRISYEPASWLYPEPAESSRRKPILFISGSVVYT